MKKEDKMTYSFNVSINGGKPINFDDMSDEERREICEKLKRQFVEDGLHGTVITA